MRFMQKMTLAEMLQRVLQSIDRLRGENEALLEDVAAKAQAISQLHSDNAALQAHVQRLLPFELEARSPPSCPRLSFCLAKSTLQ
jgi:hypothetical protein